MKFKRFTKPQFLKGIGRELLGKLFGKFTTELEAKKVAMPAPGLDDDEYFTALSAVAMAPDALPEAFIETLFAMEAMANEFGRERLVSAVAADPELNLKFDAKSDDAYLWLGIALRKAGRNAEARKAFAKAIAINPNRLIHYIELGRIYAEMGRKEEARANILKGLSMPDKEKDDPEMKDIGRETLKKLGYPAG